MIAVLVLSSFFCFVFIALGIALLVLGNTREEEEGGVAGGGGVSGGGGGPVSTLGVDKGALNASGSLIPPVVTKDGRPAFEVVLKKGMIHKDGSNTFMYMKPGKFFPSEACRVRFKLWFDDAFEWTATSSHRVGGKLGGFRMGEGKSTGGYYTDGAASFRLTFTKDRGAEGYFYPQLRKDHTTHSSGDPSWDLLDQDAGLVQDSYVAMGVHVFSPNKRPHLQFKSGQWNDIELFVKLNTPGKRDGVMELAVNGQRRRHDKVRYRNTDIKIESFLLEPFFGGGSNDWAPSRDVRLWYADFAFGSS